MRLGIVLSCVVLLAALGYGVYSVRADALAADNLRLEEQQRRNRALEQDTTRLQAFVDSPICADNLKP